MNDHRGWAEGHRCAGHLHRDPAGAHRSFALPGDAEHFRRARPFDLTHLHLELALLVAERTVSAAASLTFQRRDPAARTLVLDAVAFDVAAVTLVAEDGETEVPFTYDGERISIALGSLEHGTVRVRYRATPKRGLYFIAPDEHLPSRPSQVWSQCQDEDARHWFPCHDAPDMRMTTELVVTAPAPWHVISNGDLVARFNGSDGTSVWHWAQRSPHPSYLVTLVAGTFSELDATRDPARPVRYYVDPGREDDGWRTLGRTPDMIDQFSALTGVDYPWSKYDQVTVREFTFGGMENTSVSTLTDRCLLDARAALDAASDDLVAHELAHQWFGDLVTCRDWSHAWLNEGFATFFEHLDVERRDGREASLYNLKQHADAYFGEAGDSYRRPVVCATWGAPIDVFDRHLYEKGGWVLHMLRGELGDAVFWRGVNAYLEKNRGRSVETHDLQRAMEDASGRSLGRFFRQWIFLAGHPEIEVETKHDADRGTLHVTLRQTQPVDAQTPCFHVAVSLAVLDADGHETRRTLDLDDVAKTFTLACLGAPKSVTADPEFLLLAKLSQKLPAPMLRWQLATDARAPVRWRAAQALVAHDGFETIAALAKAVREDLFWGVSAEAARALGELRTAPLYAALAGLAGHSHPKVRRAVVRALGEYRTDASAELLLRLLAAGDASWLVESELARSAGRTRRKATYEPLLQALARESWRDVLRIGAIDGLAALRDLRAVEPLLKLLAPSHGTFVRRAASAALAELGEGHRDVREAMEALLDENDPHLLPEVLKSLGKLRSSESVGAVSRLLRKTDDGRVRRAAREALRTLEAREGDAELRRLRDDLEALRDELRGLRDRVAVAEEKPRKAPRKSQKT